MNDINQLLVTLVVGLLGVAVMLIVLFNMVQPT